jgi:hypothetical protein
MRGTKGLQFAETSSSLENLREERKKNRITFLKELNWDNYEKIRVVGKGMLSIISIIFSLSQYQIKVKNLDCFKLKELLVQQYYIGKNLTVC